MSTKAELPPEAFAKEGLEPYMPHQSENEYFVVDIMESRLRFRMDALGDRGLSFLLAALAIGERRDINDEWVGGISAITSQFTTTAP